MGLIVGEPSNVILAGPALGPVAVPTFRALVLADLPISVQSFFVPEAANLVYAGPTTGSPAVPTFRSLIANDFTSQSANTSLLGPVSGSSAVPTFRRPVPDDLKQAARTCVNVLSLAGVVGDGVNDDGPVLAAALDTYAGRLIYFPYLNLAGNPAVYFCSVTLNMNGPSQTLEGEGCGYIAGPTIKFPAGVVGITMFNNRCPGACVRDLVISGSEFFHGNLLSEAVLPAGWAGALASTPPHGLATSDGIQMLCTFGRIENCVIQGFGRHGIACWNTDANTRSADNFHFKDTLCIYNRGHGLYLQGGDSNAGTTDQVRVYFNQLWGIQDDGFLGNLHLAPQASVNHQDVTVGAVITSGVWTPAGIDGGAYKAVAGVQSVVWINPYSEGGQGPSKLSGYCIVIGGTNGAGDATGFTPCRLAVDGNGRVYFPCIEGKNNVGGGAMVGADLGALNGFGTAFRWFTADDSQDWRIVWKPGGVTTGMWHMVYGNTTAQPAFMFATSTAPSNLPPGTPVVAFYLGWVYGTNHPRWTYAAAAPTTGTYEAGSIVWNGAPTAGGKVGFVCVTGGTPGTWKPFGAIDP